LSQPKKKLGKNLAFEGYKSPNLVYRGKNWSGKIRPFLFLNGRHPIFEKFGPKKLKNQLNS
jgi:hypothetical protein